VKLLLQGLKIFWQQEVIANSIEDIGKDSWKRIESADEKYFEVPFALGEAGSIVHGVIDLVFKEGSEWIIVDYKTDDFEGDKERKKAYIKQVELYKKYWEEISGEYVKEVMLLFMLK